MLFRSVDGVGVDTTGVDGSGIDDGVGDRESLMSVGGGTLAKVAGTGSVRHRVIGQATTMERPTTEVTGTKGPPGSSRWKRESPEADR